MDTLNQQKQRSKTTYYVLVGMSTAILLATPVLILLGIGYFLDKIFQTSPYIMVIGGVIGFIGGIVNVYTLLTRTNIK